MKLKNAVMISLMTIILLLLININVFAKTVVVTVDSLRLRETATTDADNILKGLVKGDKLEYISEEGNWYKVKSGSTTGYVSKDFTKLQEDEEEPTTTKTETKTENTEKEEETKKEEEKQEEQKKEAVPTQMKLAKDSSIYILPLINANKIGEIKKDSNVKILSRTNGWFYVETDEMFGWLREASLTDPSVVSDDRDTVNTTASTDTKKEEEKKSEDKEITAKTMYVNTSSIYVRKGPATTYDDIDSLVLNNAVKVVAENGDWYKVDIDGKTGYIAKRLLSDSKTSTTRSETQRTEQESKPQTDVKTDAKKEEAEKNTTTTSEASTASSKGQQIVDFAKKYLGKKYVYGGSGPNTFDCSGFTMYVYKNFGVSLSHSATAQSKVGKYVAKSDLQPGDLVFFTDYQTGNGIGHVGIYVGNGDFIHASSGTGYCVKYSTLTSGSYLKRYETARRIF